MQNFVVDWAVNHQGDFSEQLAHGFRVLDLRFCYLPDSKTYHWWHGVAGAEVHDGLQQIKHFLEKYPKEVLILRISHLNCPGLSVKCRRLDIPSQVLKVLGNHLYSTLCDNLIPSKLFQARTTFEQIWKTKRNAFIFIEDTLYNRLGHSDVFVYNWADKRVHGARFPFLTNPRRVLQYREVVLSTQRRSCNDVMTYNPFIVTHQTVNMIGALLQTKTVLFLLTMMSVMCYYGFNYFFDRSITVQGAMLSLLLGHTCIFLTTQCLGFEGQASSLIEMSQLANVTGMGSLGSPFNKWYPPTQIYNQAFNKAIRMWSHLPNEYKLNIITVDDFHSSKVVDIAIDFVTKNHDDQKLNGSKELCNRSNVL